MLITIRGTDSNNNKAAHVTALLAGMNASSKSRKSLVLQFCKSVPIEDLLIGKKKQETDIREVGLMLDDTGIDALFRRIETQRLEKEHFDACSTPILDSENLLDIATKSTKENFADEIVNREEDIESLLKQAQEIYDDIFIYADSSDNNMLTLLNKFSELTIICIRQGIKEEISSVPGNVIYLVTGYDKNSTYSIRYMKNLYKYKKMYVLPYSSEMKDAYNRGTLMQFIGSNEKISPEDVTYPLVSAARLVLDAYLEDKESEEIEEKEVTPLENSGKVGAELAEYSTPPVEVAEKKSMFSRKTKKIVSISEEKGENAELEDEELEEKREETAKERKLRLKAERKASKNNKTPVPLAVEDLSSDEDEAEEEDDGEEFVTEMEDVQDISEDEGFNDGVVNTEANTVKEPAVKKQPTEDEWVCPDCGEINQLKAKFCLECGTKRPEPEPEPEPVVQEIAEWVCADCGETNQFKAKFCLECGAKKPEPEPVIEEPKEWVCPSCGETNQPNAKFCLECGAKK